MSRYIKEVNTCLYCFGVMFINKVQSINIYPTIMCSKIDIIIVKAILEKEKKI